MGVLWMSPLRELLCVLAGFVAGMLLSVLVGRHDA